MKRKKRSPGRPKGSTVANAVRRNPQLNLRPTANQRERWHAAAAVVGESLNALASRLLDEFADEHGV